MALFEDVITESSTIALAQTDAYPLLGALSSQLTASDTPVDNERYGVTPADQLSTSDALVVDKRYLFQLLETVELSEAIPTEDAVTVLDALSVAGAPVAGVKLNVLLDAVLRLRAQSTTGATIDVVDQLTIDYTTSYVLALAVIERLGLTETLAASLKLGRTVTDQLQILDQLRRFLAGSIVDDLSVTPALTAAQRFSAALTGDISLAEAVSPYLLLRVTTTDEISLSATDAVQALYDGRLSDAVEMTAAYLAPDGSLTTWAVNTRTAATTEYTSYGFNSFGALGGRYLAASSAGLFELAGDTDDGSDIIATLKTGLAQLGGSRYTSFRAAYLGVRGGGDFVLKLETGDGKNYHYAVTANDMETAKINLGKGLRARYFSFELISSGQDFDLDSLEFVPITAQRRV